MRPSVWGSAGSPCRPTANRWPFLRRHQWTEAIQHLRIVCDAKPDWQAAWENLAQAMLGTEHYETVIPFLDDCMTRFPDNPAFAFRRAEALFHKGDRAAAEAAFRGLTQVLPGDPEVWTGLAAAVIQDGRKDEAEALIAQGQPGRRPVAGGRPGARARGLRRASCDGAG